MALDIHLLQNTREAPTHRVGHFDEQTHEALFQHPSVNSQLCPLLFRIRDYYADAVFTSGELVGVIDEVNALLAQPIEASQINALLVSFREICELARKKRLVVVCIAD